MAEESIDLRFVDALFLLSRGSKEPVDWDVAQWMERGGFARPQNIVSDGAQGGLVITSRGMEWLEVIGRGGEIFLAPGTSPHIGESGDVDLTVGTKDGLVQRLRISREAFADHFGAANGTDAELIAAFNRGLHRILKASIKFVGHAPNGIVVVRTSDFVR